MDAVIPWARLIALIEPHSPKAGQGRQPLGLEKMLRIYFLQQWFNLSDPQAEDAIYDSESMRRFARVELGDDVVPDESTILRFRHLLEQHGLSKSIFDAIAGLLEEKRLLLRAGTIVDATIIAAPSSTKNASQTRDPEMKRTRKGKNWHFGMKLHIGADKRGLVHHGDRDQRGGGRYHPASRAAARAGAGSLRRSSGARPRRSTPPPGRAAR
jgi:IS5 family transposase